MSFASFRVNGPLNSVPKSESLNSYRHIHPLGLFLSQSGYLFWVMVNRLFVLFHTPATVVPSLGLLARYTRFHWSGLPGLPNTSLPRGTGLWGLVCLASEMNRENRFMRKYV